MIEFPIKNCFRLYERRVFAIDYPRSRLIGLEISIINAIERAGLAQLNKKNPAVSVSNSSFPSFNLVPRLFPLVEERAWERDCPSFCLIRIQGIRIKKN
jgi:hypothetical protein